MNNPFLGVLVLYLALFFCIGIVGITEALGIKYHNNFFTNRNHFNMFLVGGIFLYLILSTVGICIFGDRIVFLLSLNAIIDVGLMAGAWRLNRTAKSGHFYQNLLHNVINGYGE